MKKNMNKNFGYGKSMTYACKQALTEYYNGGHFGTVAKYSKEFKIFIRYLRAKNIRQLNDIKKEDFIDFAKYINKEKKRGRFDVKTAQNIISACNCVMRITRGDNYFFLSPKKYVGKRIDQLQCLPKWLDKDKQKAAYDYLIKKDNNLDYLLIKFIDLTGCRLEEACKQNYKDRLCEAKKTGYIDITEGTKGGHGKHYERFILATPEIIMILLSLVKHQKSHHSIIPKNMSFIRFYNNFSARWYRVAKKYDLKGFNDFRKTRAIIMYESMTGFKAPIYGDEPAPKDVDYRARSVIAKKYGHQRNDVTNYYLGGKRRVKNKPILS
jgi:integrase